MLSRTWNALLLMAPMTALCMTIGFCFTLLTPGAIAFAPFLLPMFLCVSLPAGFILSWKLAPMLRRWLADSSHVAPAPAPVASTPRPATARAVNFARHFTGTHVLPTAASRPVAAKAAAPKVVVSKPAKVAAPRPAATADAPALRVIEGSRRNPFPPLETRPTRRPAVSHADVVA